MISAIVAVNEDWGIGYNGDLLEHIPADLKFFKEMTVGKTVIMGLNTWNSLPTKPLPNRVNVIIDFDYDCEIISEGGQPRIIKCDMEHCIQGITNPRDQDMIIMGGGSIYRQLLPYCDQVYVTKIYKKHENVDTYFPNLDEMDCWQTTPIGELETYKDFTYQFWQYDRNS